MRPYHALGKLPNGRTEVYYLRGTNMLKSITFIAILAFAILAALWYFYPHGHSAWIIIGYGVGNAWFWASLLIIIVRIVRSAWRD